MNAPGQPLLHADGTPLHKQLFIVLRDQISRGARAAGSSLPTEEALGEQFGVSRVTWRRTLADLEASGFVERRHGRGTFVREQGPGAMPAINLGLLESLQQSALETHVEVLAVRSAAPPRAGR